MIFKILNLKKENFLLIDSKKMKFYIIKLW